MLEDLYHFLHVMLAAFLAGIIGWERERRDMPAGLRTHMIVGSAAALLVILGHMMVDFYNFNDSNASMQYDPLRVVEAIIVGISFIGAGTILKVESNEKIRYLTSAATILISAGIGIAVALERFVMAILVTGMVLVINSIIRKWEAKQGREEE